MSRHSHTHHWHHLYGHRHAHHYHHHLHHRGGLRGVGDVEASHRHWFNHDGANLPEMIAHVGRGGITYTAARGGWSSGFNGDYRGFTASLPSPTGSAGVSAGSNTVSVNLSTHIAKFADGAEFEIHSGHGAGMDNEAYAYTRMMGPPKKGDYGITKTAFMGDSAWLINGVPGRSGILFHSAGIRLRGDSRPGASEGCVTVRADQWQQFKQEMQKNRVRSTSITA